MKKQSIPLATLAVAVFLLAAAALFGRSWFAARPFQSLAEGGNDPATVELVPPDVKPSLSAGQAGNPSEISQGSSINAKVFTLSTTDGSHTAEAAGRIISPFGS